MDFSEQFTAEMDDQMNAQLRLDCCCKCRRRAKDERLENGFYGTRIIINFSSGTGKNTVDERNGNLLAKDSR